MLGAITGDIVGSVYEWNNYRAKDFPFFRADCFFTDDSIMTFAVAEAILNGGGAEQFAEALKAFGRRYPHADYGGRFRQWLLSAGREPYYSFGNGAAMRVAPCAEHVFRKLAPDADEDQAVQAAMALARASAAVTHNHPEGIKGAEATAYAQMMGYLHGPARAKERILKDIPAMFGYDLARRLDDIRPVYRFDESCQGTVPEAIIAFLESDGFEDAIRNAISIGGDSDTLAAITGAIAEAAYGIPDALREQAIAYLDQPLRALLQRWEQAHLD